MIGMRRAAVCAVVLAGLLAAGCASGPEAGSEAPPQWVLTAPPEKDGYVYYVGAGERGSIAASEEAARQEIINEIMQFIGVDVTSEADTTVKATLDSYQAEMVSSIKVQGSAKLKSLALEDKWVNPADGTSVYLLVKYSKADLIAEQKRLEALIR